MANLICGIAGHAWAGCKCERCGTVRDEEHSWNRCKCEVCGAVRDVDHVWTDNGCETCGAPLSSEAWAQRMKDKKDYRSLAAAYRAGWSGKREDQRKSDIARSILAESGTGAAEAVLEELAANQGLGIFWAKLLVEIGDPIAVPLLRERLERGDFKAYITDADNIKRFAARLDEDYNREITEKASEEARKKKESLATARAAVSSYDDAAMLAGLRELCHAYATMSPGAPEIERLEPIATAIGQRLNDRGGIDEMRRMFSLLEGVPAARTLERHWGGIGAWWD